jgi:conjugative relaxase-like TrwC/TraI family protein
VEVSDVLTIYAQTSASDVKRYFDTADYYSQGQETIGRWGGKLSRELGLSGPVTKREFDLLCDSINPQTGERLTARTNDERRVGYDFTFSGPKSYSILAALAPEELRRELRAAFDESVEATMEEAEADMRCRVRKEGMDADRITGNMLWASYHHTTSRPVEGQPPDMQEHTNVFAFNATIDPVEKRIKAGQFGQIKRDGEYYTALFYSKLAAELQAMGFAIDRRGGKEWEIAGIPDSMIHTFTKRSREIEAEHERRLRDDPDYRPEYKYDLAAQTRAKKDKELTPEELRAAWRAQCSDEEIDALAAVYRRAAPAGETVTAAEAVAYAVRHCFESEAAVSEKERVKTALLYGLGCVSADQVRAELPAQGFLLADMDGRLMATTQAAYGKERFITSFARAGRGVVDPVGVPEGLTRTLKEGKTLDDEQWSAVAGLLTSCDRVQLVDSAAGVGKSTMLGKFDEGMTLVGRDVTYLATTTPAVDVLRKDGFAAETVAKFLLSSKMQEAAIGGTVVIDESSMLGLRDAYELSRLAKEKDIRLIYLGDSRQHSSVAAGAVMRTLKEYGGLTPLAITGIKRQTNRDHKEAVKLMFEGKTAEGFDLLDQKLGWVHEIADDGQRYRAMAMEYVAALKSGMKWNEVLLLSPTHAEGKLLTEAVRERMKQEKLIGKTDHEFTRWVSADLTEAQRTDERHYRPGRVDMVQFFQRATGHAIGSRVMIGADGAASLPLGEAERFQAYRKETIQFAKGDILRFTANGMTLDGHQIRNGQAYRIAGFTAKGIRLENGWLVGKDFGHWKPGIETSFGSQSKTVKLAIVGQSSQSLPASNMEQAYVSASRSTIRVSTYTDDKEELRQAIQRSSLKLAAHDLVRAAATGAGKAEAREGYQQWRGRRRKRQAYLDRCRRDESAWAARQKPAPQPEPPQPPSHAERLNRERRPSYAR